MSTANNKDTIYVDVDDEITNIIDKIQSSDKKIVALVLPKRATVLQSIVNMKLLKRTADSAKKNIVLITSEAGLLPLAGAVGVHVAKNLQSKPSIPSAPNTAEPAMSVISDEDITPEEPSIDTKKSVGELAGKPESEDDVIEVDNTDVGKEALVVGDAAAKAKKTKKKGFKIPNFVRFRVLLFLGIFLVVLLIAGTVWAIAFAPKATITIKTDSTTVNSNVAFTASTTQPFDASKKVVSAARKEVKQTDAEKVPATGKKDVGTKASGSVTLTNCSDSSVTVPAGTGVSSGNLTFITQKSVQLDDGDFTSGGVCKTSGSHVGDVQVVAQNNGDQYNLSARDYTVAGFSSIKARGDDMSGGTSKIIKVVSQVDVDDAKQKLSSKSSQGASDELKKQLKEAEFLPLTDSLVTSDPVATTTPNVGDEASEVTVTATTTSSMFGVKADELKQLIEEDAKTKIDTSKQAILDNGLNDASFVVQQDKKATTQLKATVQSLVQAGPQLDTEGIKREVAGKKKGETIDTIQGRPGIKEVTVSYSPFWVSKTPKKLQKITIVFDQTKANAQP